MSDGGEVKSDCYDGKNHIFATYFYSILIFYLFVFLGRRIILMAARLMPNLTRLWFISTRFWPISARWCLQITLLVSGDF
jgi:hypothetical protein